MCDYSLQLQIPLSQVFSFSIIIPSQNRVLISHPCKSRGQCGGLLVHLSRPTFDVFMPSTGDSQRTCNKNSTVQNPLYILITKYWIWLHKLSYKVQFNFSSIYNICSIILHKRHGFVLHSEYSINLAICDKPSDIVTFSSLFNFYTKWMINVKYKQLHN